MRTAHKSRRGQGKTCLVVTFLDHGFGVQNEPGGAIVGREESGRSDRRNSIKLGRGGVCKMSARRGGDDLPWTIVDDRRPQ